mmetsp:Transcript_21187/g.36427  ORF Transcript_21187/g.36427 Transcript_21187/m.36427 type:complete len:603 (+) Transcript_21187:100-1908(+)
MIEFCEGNICCVQLLTKSSRLDVQKESMIHAIPKKGKSLQSHLPANLYQAPTADMTSSGQPSSPDSSPKSPPNKQARKEPLHGSIPKGNTLPKEHAMTKNVTNAHGRKDPSYRHPNSISPHNSPTTIGLKKRYPTFPASISSPSLFNHLFHNKYDGAPVESSNGGHNNNLEMRKASGEDAARGRARSYDCDYNCALESAFEDSGVTELKPSEVKKSTQQRTKDIIKNNSRTSPKLQGKKNKQSNSPATKLKKSAPVDVDAVSLSSSVSDLKRPTRLESSRKMSLPRKPEKDGKLSNRQDANKSQRSPSSPVDLISVSRTTLFLDDLKRTSSLDKISSPQKISSTRSAPTEAELHELNQARFDRERLLNQMGMDVTEDDYCIEGEFASNHNNRHVRGRSQSYDCNYNHPLDSEFEEFGVERKLFVNNQPPEECNEKKWTRARWMKTVRRTLGKVGTKKHHNRDSTNNADKQSNNKIKASKKKVLSVVGGKNRPGAKSKVPDQIVALSSPTSFATITPTTSEDHEDWAMSPEETRLLYRWQTARIRSHTDEIILPPLEQNRRKDSSSQGKTRNAIEDVLSITSSCGDKTAPMDNRRRHKRGISL